MSGACVPRGGDWTTRPFSEWGNEDLLACARWWACQLGLDSWTITAEFKPYREVDAWARARIFNNFEAVSIGVAPWPERVGSGIPGRDDLEVSVALMLVHVRFWCAGACFEDAGTVALSAFEVAIEKTAQALVRQRRRAPK